MQVKYYAGAAIYIAFVYGGPDKSLNQFNCDKYRACHKIISVAFSRVDAQSFYDG
jgi:hypothetical protein